MTASSPFVILVAEDDQLVRNVVRTTLIRAGYTVLDAKDGAHALEISRGYDGMIHALLTDVIMPNMDGLELSDHITRERPGIKVLLMSGKTSAESLVGESMQFLRKPFLPNTLRERLSVILDGSSLRE
jgi:two-component system, cell cycle sensor histidine kinase and response regulator CckA